MKTVKEIIKELEHASESGASVPLEWLKECMTKGCCRNPWTAENYWAEDDCVYVRNKVDAVNIIRNLTNIPVEDARAGFVDARVHGMNEYQQVGWIGVLIDWKEK